MKSGLNYLDKILLELGDFDLNSPDFKEAFEIYSSIKELQLFYMKYKISETDIKEFLEKTDKILEKSEILEENKLKLIKIRNNFSNELQNILNENKILEEKSNFLVKIMFSIGK